MRGLLLIIGLLGMLGCVPVYPGERTPPSQPVEIPKQGSRFDGTNTGCIRGYVVWTADAPKLLLQLGAVPIGQGLFEFREFPHPFQPKLQNRRLAEVLVELIGVDPSLSKPMNFPAVQVVLKDAQMHLLSGDQPTSMAIVPVGGTLKVTNQDSYPHNLQGRGADFFALSLPPGSAPRTRLMTKPGRVDLRSGLGYYWHAATLQVVDHPYWAVTNHHGEYELTDVPPGEYQIRFVMNNWIVLEQGRDPESGLIFRQTYAEPISTTKRVTLHRRQVVIVDTILGN